MWPDVFVFSLSVEDSGIPGQYNGLIMCGLTFLFLLLFFLLFLGAI